MSANPALRFATWPLAHFVGRMFAVAAPFLERSVLAAVRADVAAP